MIGVPKSQRLTLALAGRTNAGKSTLLNFIAGQDVAITSPHAGTTTDVVEKGMELLPFGPVLWLDTGGWDDDTALGEARRKRTEAALRRADAVIAVVTAEDETPDARLAALAQSNAKPLLAVMTQIDRFPPSPAFRERLASLFPGGKSQVLEVSALETGKARDAFLKAFKTALSAILPSELTRPPALLDGIVPPGGTVLQIIPIDSQAPKGRIILPQMNVLRDALDKDVISIVVTENRITDALNALKCLPDLAICDSQVVHRMIAELPSDVRCTTYSILMARIKGDLQALAEGAAAIESLKDGDRILIAEACTHHAAEEDIGRVKIPAMLRKRTGRDLAFEVVSGRDFPQDLTRYALIVHCGGCMINRPLMLWRIEQARQAGVPITNYGVCISAAQGVLARVLEPFQKSN